MYKKKKISVTIPIHNEEKHIRSVITELPDYVDIIIIVDDGCTDNSL